MPSPDCLKDVAGLVGPGMPAEEAQRLWNRAAPLEGPEGGVTQTFMCSYEGCVYKCGRAALEGLNFVTSTNGECAQRKDFLTSAATPEN